jgi:O-antigen ligase
MFKVVIFAQAFCLYGLLFPGVVKVFIGASFGALLNVAFFIVFVVLSFFYKYRFITLNAPKLFVNFLLIYLFTTIVYLFIFSNQVSYLAVSNLGKVVIAVIVSIILLHSRNNQLLIKYLTLSVYFFGVSVIIWDWAGLLDKGQVGVNYLTLTMPVAVMASYLLFKLFFLHSSFIVKLFNFSLLFLSLTYLLLSGSRVALLIVILLFLIIFLYKVYKKKPHITLFFIVIMSFILLYLYNVVIPSFLEKNNFYLYSRIYLDSSESVKAINEGMSRPELYRLSLDYILDGNIFGYGVGATHDLLKVQYVESYFLEALLNYGLLIGGCFLLSIHIPWLFSLSKTNSNACNIYFNNLLLMSFCNYLFFIKGWGLYDFSGQLILLSLLIAESKNVYSERKNEIYYS